MEQPNTSFETVLATHCAPVFLGKKPAALFPLGTLQESCPWGQLRQRGFPVLRLTPQGRGRSPLVLVCHPQLLQDTLDREPTRGVLAEMGYPVHRGWRAMVAHLARRFREEAVFPHEVGFFLGYPPGDVLGFLAGAKPQNLCGPWRVYGNPDGAAACFADYATCRQVLLEHLGRGGSIWDGLPPQDRAPAGTFSCPSPIKFTSFFGD